MTDAPTRDDIAEKLGHLCANAKRLRGVEGYYDRAHGWIDEALYEWQAAPAPMPTPSTAG